MIDQAVLWIAGTVAALIVGAIYGRLAATSEALAAPRRAKPEADRTVIDKALIEADKRIDALNIAQFEVFLSDFIAANLHAVIKTAPVIGPMATAAGYVDNALEAFRRRNPDLANVLNPSRQTMQEKLAGSIGKATRDVLADALREAIKAPLDHRAPIPPASTPSYRSGDLPHTISSGGVTAP